MPNPPLIHIRLLAAFLRFFFSLLYYQLAWTYDWVAAIVSIGMWKEWIFSVLPYLSGTKILEIGHGPGHLLLALHQKSRLAIGLDLSPQMNKIARGRLARHNLTPKLILGAAQNIPLLTNSMDHVVATFPSEYIFNNKTTSEAYRVLKPGGTWIIVPFAWITGKSLMHRAGAWLFSITGESPKSDNVALQPLINAGFLARTEMVELPSSKVLIIHAQKPQI